MGKQTKQRAELLAELPATLTARIRLTRQYPGLITEVAQKLGVRAATVSNTIRLRSASAKIEKCTVECINTRILNAARGIE